MTEQRDWARSAAWQIEGRDDETVEPFFSETDKELQLKRVQRFTDIIRSAHACSITLCDPHCKVPGHIPLREHYRDGREAPGDVLLDGEHLNVWVDKVKVEIGWYGKDLQARDMLDQRIDEAAAAIRQADERATKAEQERDRLLEAVRPFAEAWKSTQSIEDACSGQGCEEDHKHQRLIAAINGITWADFHVAECANHAQEGT